MDEEERKEKKQKRLLELKRNSIMFFFWFLVIFAISATTAELWGENRTTKELYPLINDSWINITSTNYSYINGAIVCTKTNGICPTANVSSINVTYNQTYDTWLSNYTDYNNFWKEKISTAYLNETHGRLASQNTWSAIQTISGKNSWIYSEQLATIVIQTITFGSNLQYNQQPSTTTITSANAGTSGQLVVYQCQDTFTAITDSATINLAGSTFNCTTLGLESTLTLIYSAKAGNWIELTRSDN